MTIDSVPKPAQKQDVHMPELEGAPVEGQHITINGKTYTTVREGQAFILVPERARTEMNAKAPKPEAEEVQTVFYNPIQQFNRDLSVLAIRVYAEDLQSVRQQKADLNRSRGTKRKRGHEQGHEIAKNGNGEKVSNGLSSNKADAGNNQELTTTQQEVQTANTNPNDDKPKDEEQDLSHSKEQQQVVRGPLRVLDALSATGLRALRYAREIPLVTSITANDLSSEATDMIRINAKYNNVASKINIETSNAMALMHSVRQRFDVIDLDPYGTAVPFLDAAVQAVADGGMLCVTCTDSSLFASIGFPEKTFAVYGGTAIKGLHSHEGGLRLIIHAIATAAARYGRSVEPLLSLSIDFYARVFVRIYSSPADVKLHGAKTMIVYGCDVGCGAWSLQPLIKTSARGVSNDMRNFKFGLSRGPVANTTCTHCGAKTQVSGPMYGGPLHNPKFIEAMLQEVPLLDKQIYGTVERLEGVLTTALEETFLDDIPMRPTKLDLATSTRRVPKVDPSYVDRNPFYFIPSALAKVFKTMSPSEAALRGALKHAGYASTRSHARPGSIKTNAPWSFIWTIMREWVKQKSPIKEGSLKPGTPNWTLMHGTGDVPDKSDAMSEDGEHGSVSEVVDKGGHEAIVFDEALGKEVNKKRLRRYQENPRPNWGPMGRAKS